MSTASRAFVLALSLLALAAPAMAGPLNPPAGPVAVTAKPLAEIEPRTPIGDAATPGDATSRYRITQPGSYYLTGNITGVAGKHGIAIAASGVTIDLNGFEVLGAPAMGAFDGVSAAVNGLTNLTVRNGSVRNWGAMGVNLLSGTTETCRVADILASGNASHGIAVGPHCTVTNCAANSNGADGILASTATTVSNCAASLNVGNGIRVQSVCTVLNCSASQNGTGITINTGCTLTNCSAGYNHVAGISNGGNAGEGCSFTSCAAFFNTGDGISCSGSCVLSSCSSNSNTGNGIRVNGSSIVQGCSASYNNSNGIQCGIACTIRDTTCVSNGIADGAGILVTSGDNRIEGNQCTTADRGIQVVGVGNIIVRNTCSGNTLNWSIAANNVCAPILDRTAPASAAISGNSAPGSLGSTDPNANFTY